jgi:hypothetical protein
MFLGLPLIVNEILQLTNVGGVSGINCGNFGGERMEDQGTLANDVRQLSAELANVSWLNESRRFSIESITRPVREYVNSEVVQFESH